jgi:hypothetical protein
MDSMCLVAYIPSKQMAQNSSLESSGWVVGAREVYSLPGPRCADAPACKEGHAGSAAGVICPWGLGHRRLGPSSQDSSRLISWNTSA